MTTSASPPFSTEPTMRATDTPEVRTTASSDDTARVPSPMRAPITAASGNRTNACLGSVRSTNSIAPPTS